MSVWLLALALQAATSAAPAATPAPPVPAVFISAAEAEAVLNEQIAKAVVDQPIKASTVPGGLASVAWLHRSKAEAGGLIHNTATETYYIVKGSGTLVTGGALVDAKPIDLTRLNAGMGIQGRRQGGDSRRVAPGDIIIIPAGTPHGFSELDGPISYLVFRFDAKP
jgi:mannose-6-phosphate isomerase-like protein (cupin superfamily)